MYLYVELWSAKAKWLELPAEERQNFIDQIIAGIDEQIESGVEILGFAVEDPDTSHSSGYQYVAVWKMPNKQAALTFEQGIDQSPWHEYFEQINSRGPLLSASQALDRMVKL